MIAIPFQSAISPYADALEALTLDWVYRFDLYKNAALLRRLQAMKVGELAGRAFPNASFELLQIISDWRTWFYLLEDRIDDFVEDGTLADVENYCRRLLEVLNEPQSARDEPMEKGLADLWARTWQNANSEWMLRYIHSMENYLEGVTLEAEFRIHRQDPSLEEYLNARRKKIGGDVFIQFAELVENINLADAVRYHPIVHDLNAIGIDVLAWMNDILGLNRQRRAQDTMNAVLVLARERAIDAAAAVTIAAYFINDAVRAFDERTNRLPDFGKEDNEALQKYIGVWRSMMRGALDWAKSTGGKAVAELLQTA